MQKNPIDLYNGIHDATAFGPSCPQQASALNGLPDALKFTVLDDVFDSLYRVYTRESEDCLSLNIWRPTNAGPSANLPVVVWIYGGGFEIGGTSTYDGGIIVRRSIQLGEPVIYVSMNYRITAFGFLASQEVKDAGVGNLGLQDQRLALRWVQKYIGAFGGDPSKVTIWGQSAGAISAALHMLANGGDTEGLFRGAFMQSGGPIPVGDITHGQSQYDALVAQTGCSGTADTLECMRHVPYDILKQAVDRSPGFFDYQSLRLAWVPRTDGVFLTDLPQYLTLKGHVADIPFVTGNCDDEGTLYSFSARNITTESALREYMLSNYIVGATDGDIDELLALYPEDVSQGSPFDTGALNALTPQFKRIAALQGDLVFQAPRRLLLDGTAERQRAWSFLSKQYKALPFLGSAHATDLIDTYAYAYPGDLVDYLVNFVNHLDPNGRTPRFFWPQYDLASRKVLTLWDAGRLSVTNDTYRAEGIRLFTKLALKFPL
ncbi:Lipase 1 [Grifola frondosa]|uniref:Carboxylic ester hydrolase n=1 Tax=Grifola frondosa TaxID=5627 RepID=A0A1C7MFP9_GRIFR|nr:Lipase 1 [Grifola frondosa]